MNHPVRTMIAWLSGCCLVLPLAMAAPSPHAPAQTPATHAASTPPLVCFPAVFEGPLPGRSDYCLGMHDWNHGHYRNGLQFMQLAAGWGNKNAQYTLGLIYFAGHHVATNVPLGLAWLQLADERNNDAQISLARRSAFAVATPAQRHAAQHLVTRMTATYGDAVAAARAWQHLQHWRRRTRGNSGCVRLLGAQAAAARHAGLAGMPPSSIDALVHPTYEQMLAMSGGHETIRQVQEYIAQQNAGVCVTLHMQHHVTGELAQSYFAGTPWLGTVHVGPLQQIPASASTSAR
ncbi:MAG TPA: hypothetical protein VF269_02350 [Rhodanobacteraceae bacterium]